MKKTGISGAIESPSIGGPVWMSEQDLNGPFVEIVFECYQGGENNYSLTLSSAGQGTDGWAVCDPLWESYEDTELIEDLALEFGFDVDKGRERVISSRLRNKVSGGMSDEKVQAISKIDGGDLYVLRGWKTAVREVVGKWLTRVAEDAQEVGGDDSFFDYYPDNFHVARQICPALDMEQELKEATLRAVELRYSEDEENCLGQSAYTES